MLKHNKHISIYLSIFLIFFQLNAWAQGPNRTLETKVADILNETPANNGQKLNSMIDEMMGLGSPGIDMLSSMLVPPGNADDSKVRFLLNSMAFYVADNTKKSENDLYTTALLNALSKSSDTQISSFLIGRLQITANSIAVPALKKKLNDNDLVDPAVRALVAIGSADAEQALIKALKEKDVAIQTAVVQGLGEMRSAKGGKPIMKLVKTENQALKKACLYALANIPVLKAEKILMEEAGKHNFQTDDTNAVNALLIYAERLGEAGQQEQCENVCRQLMKACNQPENFRTGTAALGILAHIYGERIMSDLIKAMDSPYKSHRMAALSYALQIEGENNTLIWLDQLDKVNPEARAEIIYMLGQRKDLKAIKGIEAVTNDPAIEVKKEAWIALAKMDSERTLPLLLDQLKEGGDQQEMEFIGEVLRWIKTNRMIPTLTSVYPELSVDAKCIAIKIMSDKQASQNWSLVFLEARSHNEKLRKTAIAALSNLSAKENIPELIDLLMEVSDSDEIKNVQQAILVSALQIEPPESRADLLLKRLANAGDDEKVKIMGVLSGIGGREALIAVTDAFEHGQADVKEAAFDAMVNWSGPEAAEPLYEIASNNQEYRAKAVAGYLKLVDRSDVPSDQKRLLLEKIMTLAQNSNEKGKVIELLGRTRTYQALVLAGKYLDDPALQQKAARAVISISLPQGGHPGYSGSLVRNYLNKVSQILKGQESDYTKAQIEKYLNEMSEDEGFVLMFNGKDLTGWKGLVGNPKTRVEMSSSELATEQEKANGKVKDNWSVKDGMIMFSGHGSNLVSVKDYGDFEMIVDWKITRDGDSGIYLKGSPQVQIWDVTGAESAATHVGSGGLYNNKKHRSTPLKVADNPVNEWNTFRILMIGERVSVWLNGQLVVDDEIMDNYWERDKPIYPTGPIELQAHGSNLLFKNIYVREISSSKHNQLIDEELKEGYVQLFNGKNLDGWVGNKTEYVTENGEIVIYPMDKGHGNLYTENEYGDFVFRFEFKLTPGANNGLGIHANLKGNAAYSGMELQILDNTALIYKDLQPYQYHGSLYGVIPAKRGYLRPVGEWNEQEVIIKGTYVKITLNGTVILDGDWSDAIENGTMDHKDHPGLKVKKGHIGFLGHGSIVHFRNIRIKNLGD